MQYHRADTTEIHAKERAWSMSAARSDADIASNVVRIGAAPAAAVTPGDVLRILRNTSESIVMSNLLPLDRSSASSQALLPMEPSFRQLQPGAHPDKRPPAFRLMPRLSCGLSATLVGRARRQFVSLLCDFSLQKL